MNEQLIYNIIFKELDPYLRWHRCFTISELKDLLGFPVDEAELRAILENNPKMVCISAANPDKDHFVLDIVLLNWLCNLNIKLAQAGLWKLNISQFGLQLSRLSGKYKWKILPREIIKFGERYGYISSSGPNKYVVFPLARILSSLPGTYFDNIVEWLRILNRRCIEPVKLKRLISKYILVGLSNLPQRTAFIIMSREGPLSPDKMTLDQIGGELGLTRERVRQIEKQFWKYLIKYRRPAFIKAFICDYFLRSGTLMMEVNSQEINLRKFLAKCAGMPISDLTEIGLTLFSEVQLAQKKKSTKSIRRYWPFKRQKNPPIVPSLVEQIGIDTDHNVVVDRLVSENNVILSEREIIEIAKRLVSYRVRRLHLVEKAYLVLKEIGSPVHYSMVYERCKERWPDSSITAASIHSALLNHDKQGQYGIVWVGMKGAYALRENGYERPSKGLFLTILDIVKERYKITGKPVSYSVIVAEFPKHRSVINPNSVDIAIKSNPFLERIHEDFYLPLGATDFKEKELSEDRLDQIFRMFESSAEEEDG